MRKLYQSLVFTSQIRKSGLAGKKLLCDQNILDRAGSLWRATGIHGFFSTFQAIKSQSRIEGDHAGILRFAQSKLMVEQRKNLRICLLLKLLGKPRCLAKCNPSRNTGIRQPRSE